MLFYTLRLLFLGGLLLAAQPLSLQAAPDLVPLAARYAMAPDTTDALKLTDSGPLGIHGQLNGGVAFVTDGPRGTGHALSFTGSGGGDAGQGTAQVDDPKLLNEFGGPLTISLWIKPSPGGGDVPETLLTKTSAGWIGHPFALRLSRDGHINFDPSDSPAGGWSSLAVKTGEWAYVAITYQPSGKRILYIDGKNAGEGEAGNDLPSNTEKLMFGYEPGYNGPGGNRAKYQGLMAEVHFYAAALTPEQIQADQAGTLPTRAASFADIAPPTYQTHMHLVRWDMPFGFRDYRNATRQDAQRHSGPDAVDWPVLRLSSPLGTKTVFADGPTESVVLPEKHLPISRSVFQQADDPVITPGGHWLRPSVLALWGRRDVYTTDPTARGGNQYELWAFPIKISGPIQTVSLQSGGKTLYTRTEALHSLTLLLPQNAPGQPYQLTVNGHGPVALNVGLQPIRPGDPTNTPIKIQASLPGEGGTITVASLARPETFPNPTEWNEDFQALGQAVPPPFSQVRRAGSFTRHVGVDVPRSPEMIYGTSLHAGMSGGFKYYSEQGPGFQGTPDEYAQFLAASGFDATFEDSRSEALGNPNDPNSYERWLTAMAAHGLKAGINDISLGDPSQSFYSANLPDFHRPKYRDAQLLAQRFALFPNFLGMTMGADNAGYTWYWDWNGPTSEHPWGQAFQIMQTAAGQPLTAPLPPGGHFSPKPHEYLSTAKDFENYIARYNQSFAHYGYLGEAVQEVNPNLMMTSGSFGSAPGVGARGGYNWGTVPGREMFSGLPILQTYDWNEQSSSKPLHNVALMDRLKSYYPDKPGWALLDDFHLFFGRAPMQRAYALALTRGIQGVGTSFLANTDNIKTFGADPSFLRNQHDLFGWIHKFGGVYAQTKPMPTIGVLYVNAQALMRPVLSGENPPEDQLERGSQEGKTFEALFLCHQAGWPAKIITPEAIKRGLPPSLKAILLVGLPPVDDTWHWYDGLLPSLGAFIQKGGRLLTDDESVCPLPTIKTGMTVRAYVVNRDLDWTPELLARNSANAQKLRTALRGVALPLAETGSETVWAVPTLAGSTQYVTVVNQATPFGQNASRVIAPQTGTLAWHTARPIYDLRLGRKLTADEAKTVDLTHDGFQFYALPPATITLPKVVITRGSDDFYRAAVVIAHPAPMTGIPLQLTVTHGTETAMVYSATGLTAKLPLAVDDAPGRYTVTATELLSGLHFQTTVTIAPRPATIGPHLDASLARFAARRTVPLTIALTPSQAADPKMQTLAAKLAAFYRKQGRNVTQDTIAPNHVVVSLQPLTGVQPFPRWQTIATDLVLLGSPADNILLLDQARGYLLPDISHLPPGQNAIVVTHSPFVGECNVLNILASNSAGLAAGIRQVTGK